MPNWYDQHTPAHAPGDWVERVSDGAAHPPGTRAQVTAWGPYPESYYLQVEGPDEGIVTWMGAAIRATDPPSWAADDQDDDGQDDVDPDPYLTVLNTIAAALQRIADHVPDLLGAPRLTDEARHALIRDQLIANEAVRAAYATRVQDEAPGADCED